MTRCREWAASLRTDAAVFSRDGMLDLVRLIAYLVRLLWNDHCEHARILPAPRATKRYYANVSLGDFFVMLEEACAIVQNVEVLNRIGFIVDFGKATAGVTLDHGIIVAQDVLANEGVDIVSNLLSERAGSMLWHCGSWLGLLGMMGTGRDEDETDCVGMLRGEFRADFGACTEGEGNIVLKRMVDSCCFPATFLREIADLVSSHIKCATCVLQHSSLFCKNAKSCVCEATSLVPISKFEPTNTNTIRIASSLQHAFCKTAIDFAKCKVLRLYDAASRRPQI